MRFTTTSLVVLLAACAGDTDKTDATDNTDDVYTDVEKTGDTAPTGDTGEKKTTKKKPTDTVLANFEEKTPRTFVGFDGGSGSIVVDPTDATNNVGQIVKSGDAQPWGGTTIAACPADSIVALPFTATESSISMRVWSPDAATTFRLKVEDAGNNTVSVETDAVTTKAKTWETLTFDFSNEAKGTAALDLKATYDKVTVFPNFGTDGATAGEKTYFIDDIVFHDAVFSTDCPPPAETWPLTFDDENTTYSIARFGEGAGGTGIEAAIEADPDDAKNTVARITKKSAAETWGGASFVTMAGDSVAPLPLTEADKVVTMRVRSPIKGATVLLKIEDASDAGIFVETTATTTLVDTWETLTFDFGSPMPNDRAFNEAENYNRISAFPNFGVAGTDPGVVFYFDDVTP